MEVDLWFKLLLLELQPLRDLDVLNVHQIFLIYPFSSWSFDSRWVEQLNHQFRFFALVHLHPVVIDCCRFTYLVSSPWNENTGQIVSSNIIVFSFEFILLVFLHSSSSFQLRFFIFFFSIHWDLYLFFSSKLNSIYEFS